MTLVTALTTFAAAANQRVNYTKSAAILIGAANVSVAAPASVAGIPVVPAARLLGIPFAPAPPALPRPRPHAHNTRSGTRLHVTPPPPPHPFVRSAWASRLDAATAVLGKVVRLPLSAMGRGLAASSYGLSTALYALELGDTPPGAAAALSIAAHRALPSIPPRLLSGSPKVGGFGLLPLASHVNALHAAIAIRLVSRLLSSSSAQAPVPSPTTSPSPAAVPRHDPPSTHLAAVVLCRACPALHPAQTLLAFTESSAQAAAAGVLDLPGVAQAAAIPPGPLRRAAVALQALGPLALAANATPAGRAGVRAHLLAPPTSAAAVRASLALLAWVPAPLPANAPPAPPPIFPSAGRPVVASITTFLQLGAASARAGRHLQYVRQALASSSLAASSAPALAFRAALARAWRLPCDNRVKEPLWRLAVDAIPGSRFRNWTCPCLASSPSSSGRQHSFWDCSVAVGVRAQLSDARLPGGAVPAATQADVWLLQPPSAGTNAWPTIALCATAAMEHGRQVLWALSSDGRRGPEAVQTASNLAADRFWALLEEVEVPAPRRGPPGAAPRV